MSTRLADGIAQLSIIVGGPALSASALERQLGVVRASEPGLTSANAQWFYVAAWHVKEPSAPSLARLAELVEAVPSVDNTLGAADHFAVVPRLGTRSPWSSKATDIAAICGIENLAWIERGELWTFAGHVANAELLRSRCHDRMTQTVVETNAARAGTPWKSGVVVPQPMTDIVLGADPAAAISAVSVSLGLALSVDEIDYLAARYLELGRAPTDVELMMFAQANSEHCRHKIFNASYFVDGEPQAHSLFSMIRQTTAANPSGVLSAYHDNAAIIAGVSGTRAWPDPSGVYRLHEEPSHILGKVETHNHPTAISPFAGAATGAGGEIRDEGATGRGGKPKAGLAGFAVSNLHLPGEAAPWESVASRPDHIASPLEIMIDGPLGAAAFSNEFGRPVLTGYFRTLEISVPGDDPSVRRGFHKPIMLAGGIGAVRPHHVEKGTIVDGAPLIVLGGPAMLIGLGGGAASSVASGSQRADLDFASVQRGNPEMERRCQEVIDRCIALGDDSPIASIHDVGAGGLSNALPELVHDQQLGARLDLRAIPSAELAMSPRELWCNEAQERYVIALRPDRLSEFAALCERERAPWAVVGHATTAEHLLVADPLLGPSPVDLPLDVIFGKPPRMERNATTLTPARQPLVLADLRFAEALDRVLSLPAVADKSFLITIGDRSVTGLVARDQLVGPQQIPVADCAITLAGHHGFGGEAFASGERPAVALLDAAASARLAIAEAILNIAGAPIGDISNVKLSCNWMAAPNHPGEDARLYAAVEAARDAALALGVAIPVGKDSMSMRMTWPTGEGVQTVVSPVTLVATSFAPVLDVRRAVTPADGLAGDALVCIALRGEVLAPRFGGSALAQVLGQLGDIPPDVDLVEVAALWRAVQRLLADNVRFAYHDISDGGVVVAAFELALASGCGFDLAADHDPFLLFDETPGAVIAIAPTELPMLIVAMEREGLLRYVSVVGELRADVRARIAAPTVDTTMAALRARWSSVTHSIARLRDNEACANQEHAARLNPTSPGLTTSVPDGVFTNVAAPFVIGGARPRVAIVREQGVNGQVEMAVAFTRAGFDAVDVHMSDLIAGRHDLRDMQGFAACGGFSFGDVLGAGRGWAMSVLHNTRARDALTAFFDRPNTFSLGVCNGCQMMAHLRDIIPGAQAFPTLLTNRSERFESRLSLVEILPSPSLFFRGLVGARVPIAVAHGEGRAAFLSPQHAQAVHVAARFVDGNGNVAHDYPVNPNGSPDGMTAWTSDDGRVTILMPHPERVIRTATMSWHPRDWPDDSPWLRMFQNARAFVG